MDAAAGPAGIVGRGRGRVRVRARRGFRHGARGHNRTHRLVELQGDAGDGLGLERGRPALRPGAVEAWHQQPIADLEPARVAQEVRVGREDPVRAEALAVIGARGDPVERIAARDGMDRAAGNRARSHGAGRKGRAKQPRNNAAGKQNPEGNTLHHTPTHTQSHHTHQARPNPIDVQKPDPTTIGNTTGWVVQCEGKSP